MKKTDEPGWPVSGGFPFLPFQSTPKGAGPASSLLQGMSGGIDLWKDFWNQLPGATPMPGFLLPTVDVEELGKRIADLKAAEQWVEVNLNLLRTTIQGLEVQRNTIAALHSLSTFTDRPDARAPDFAAAFNPAAKSPPQPPAAAPAAIPEEGTAAPALAAGNWLAYLQDQFTKVAGAAIGPATAASSGAGKPKRAKPATTRRPAKRRKAASPAG